MNKELILFERMLVDIENDNILCPKCRAILPTPNNEIIDEFNEVYIYYYKCENRNCNFTTHSDFSRRIVLMRANDYIAPAEYQKYKIINLDGVDYYAEKDKNLDDSNYWAKLKIARDKKTHKLTLVVYAGLRGKDESKVQLFLMPEEEKLSFDQNNQHPNTIFTYLKAEFKDTIVDIKEKEKEKETKT